MHLRATGLDSRSLEKKVRLVTARAIVPNIMFGADFDTDIGRVRRIAAKPTVFKRGSVKGSGVRNLSPDGMRLEREI